MRDLHTFAADTMSLACVLDKWSIFVTNASGSVFATAVKLWNPARYNCLARF